MFIIESLKDYIGKISSDDFIKLATDIYQITDFICKDYPKYKEWYFKKQLAAIDGNERNILFVRNPENLYEIIAMACLKRDVEEQKICTLYVVEKFRKLGIGTKIIEQSTMWLGTTKPLITLNNNKLNMFETIIRKYNWQLMEVAEGIYNDHSIELCYNGTLSKQLKK